MTPTLSRSFGRTVAALSLLATVVAAGCGGSGEKKEPIKASLVSIAVTPLTPSLAVGGTQQFMAVGTYSDQTTMNLSATAMWTSSATTTATVSGTGLATGLAAGTTAISAKSGTVTGATTLTVTASMVAAKLVSIAVTPATMSIAKGSTQPFTATGTYDDSTKKDLTGTATWSSGTPATATVSAAGVATGVMAGTSVITATSGTVSGTATLTVTAAKLVSIVVTPTNPSIAKGSTKQFTATGTYDDTTTQDLTTSATWTSSTVATATIAATGLATGVAGGTTTITATSGTITGTTMLTVTVAKLVSIAVTPTAQTIATGTKQPFTATGTFDDTTTQDLTGTVTWASATVATATISNTAGSKGQATAVAVGTTVISATSDTIVGMVTLTVKKAALTSIAVTPVNPTIAKGTKQQFVATGTFADTTTQNLTAEVTWASATPAKATISNAAGTLGEATGVELGTSVISASLMGVTGMTTLTVTDAKVVSIAITPATPAIAKGTKLKLVATGTFTDGTTQDITALATWGSAMMGTATVSGAADSKGLATAVAPGTAVISATLSGVTGMTTLTVKDITLASIAVTPATKSLARGTQQQYVATGFFSDGSRQNLTDTATWTSATPANATISNAAGSKGLAKAVLTGTSVISAAIGAIKDSATLTVTAAEIRSLAITPAAPSIAKGTKISLVATGTFTDDTTQNLTATVVWASATAATATIDNATATAGQATGLAEGTTVISATAGTLAANVTLTVTKAVLSSLAVTPATPAIAKGTTQQFVATGTFSDQTTQVLTTTVTWASASTAKATISNAAGSVGLATAVATGDVVISATSGTITGQTTLTINDGKLKTLAVTPALTSIAAGTKLQMVATGTFDDGATQDLTEEVTWDSATIGTATISNADTSDGLATAVAKGTSVISAKLGAITGMTTLTVTDAKLASIVVTPNAVSIAKGRTQQFTAIGFFKENDTTSTQDLTDTATWATAVPATASVSNADDSKGLLTGMAVNTTNVTATVGTGATAIVGTASVKVTAAVLTSIAVTPPAPSIAKGTKQQFVATGTFSDLTTQILTTTVTWAPATGTTATVSNANGSRGLASTLAVGSVVVSATSQGIKGEATLTVTAATLVSIAVTPANPSVAKNKTQQFTATGTYTDATTQNLTSTVNWTSGTEATATISNAAASKGLATTIVAGTAQISATTGPVTGKTTLTVTN